VSARRTLHLRFTDLADLKPVPRDTDCASLFESDVPIIVQSTGLDSRRAEIALLSTMAYSLTGRAAGTPESAKQIPLGCCLNAHQLQEYGEPRHEVQRKKFLAP
jgi:hypothetical protein